MNTRKRKCVFPQFFPHPRPPCSPLGAGYAVMAGSLHLIGSDNHCSVPRNSLLNLQGLLMQCGLGSDVSATEGSTSSNDSKII